MWRRRISSSRPHPHQRSVHGECAEARAQRRRRAAVAFALATWFVAMVFVIAGRGEVAASGASPPPVRAAAPQEASIEQQLVDRFAPILYIRALGSCTGGAAFDPGPVSLVLDQPDVVLREIGLGHPVVMESPGAADIYALGPDYAIDWPGNHRRPGCRYEQDYLRIRGDDPALIYARIAREPEYDGFVIQYWFFYYFNDFLNRHEADWEGIQLAFEVDSLEEALEVGPARVAYAGHGGGERADWDSPHVQKEDGRPVVYVAEGAQASFFQEGVYLGVGRHGSVFGCETTKPPHRRVEPVVQLLPEGAAGANDEFAWLEYEGLWGEWDRSGVDRGVPGPKQSQRWSEPFSWEQGVRTWSEKLPESEALGFDALAPFCFLVGKGSMLLNFAFRSPWLFAGGTLVLVGSIVGLMTVGTPLQSRATARLEPDSYRPLMFERRRSLSQIGRAAFVLYWRHKALWLMAGALFVLVGSLATAIQAPLDVRSLVDSPFARPLLIITAGSVQGLVMVLLMEASVTVALGELARDGRPSPRFVLRGVWRGLRELAIARLRATAIVAGLLFTVVGTPWAIHRAVSWLFVEQAVLLEGAAGLRAHERSHELVAGRWWQTVRYLVVAGALLIIPGPTIAVGMMLFLDPPVSETVYLVDSLLYALLLAPIYAITKVLLYFSFRAQQQEQATTEAAPAE